MNVQETNLSFQAPQSIVGERRVLNCDICGRQIVGQAFKVKVEGAKMLVCRSCQALGKPYQDEPIPRPAPLPSFAARVRLSRIPVKRPAELPKEIEELDVAENFAALVRKARMKLGWSQEELATKVKEKLSVIQKIETGKITPDTQLCRRLQHELKIKLLVPRKETPPPKISAPAEITLGDIVKIKGKADTSL
jgi:putative transcription factor